MVFVREQGFDIICEFSSYMRVVFLSILVESTQQGLQVKIQPLLLHRRFIQQYSHELRGQWFLVLQFLIGDFITLTLSGDYVILIRARLKYHLQLQFKNVPYLEQRGTFTRGFLNLCTSCDSTMEDEFIFLLKVLLVDRGIQG